MNNFRYEVEVWNRVVFSNIFDMKYRYLARLSGIQRELGIRKSIYLEDLKRKVRNELNEALN